MNIELKDDPSMDPFWVVTKELYDELDTMQANLDNTNEELSGVQIESRHWKKEVQKLLWTKWALEMQLRHFKKKSEKPPSKDAATQVDETCFEEKVLFVGMKRKRGTS